MPRASSCRGSDSSWHDTSYLIGLTKVQLSGLSIKANIFLSLRGVVGHSRVCIMYVE